MGAANAPCGLSSHHRTGNNSVTSEGDRAFLKQPVNPLTLGNMKHTVSRDWPNTLLCAAPSSAAGVQGGSQVRGQHRKMQTCENCAPTNRGASTGDQGGQKLLAEQHDVRHMAPEDATCTNATTAAEPLRRMVSAETRRVADELPKSAVFPTKHGINPSMQHMRRWVSRPKITIPMGIMLVVENRILPGPPDSVTSMPSDEWVAQNLNEALTVLSKTGSGRDGKLALSTFSLIRNDQQLWGRAGKTSPHLPLG